MRRLACALLFCSAACGSVSSRPPDDATPIDGGADAAIDAGDIDAPPPTPPTPSREVVGGAGRVRGTTFTFDVELGHPIGQQPARGATFTLQGNAAVKP